MTAKTTEPKTLHEKLVEVAALVRNIDKGGYNEAQHYSFVQESDVVRTVWPLFLERGVLFYPVERTVESVHTYQVKSGSTSFLTTVRSVWRATDGVDTVDVPSLGQGADTGDKGVSKALTGDKKYAVLHLLGIATGDDAEQARPDERAEVKEPTKPILTDDQKTLLQEEAIKAGFNLSDMEQAALLGQRINEWTGKTSINALDNDDLTTILENLRAIQTVAGATA